MTNHITSPASRQLNLDRATAVLAIRHAVREHEGQLRLPESLEISMALSWLKANAPGLLRPTLEWLKKFMPPGGGSWDEYIEKEARRLDLDQLHEVGKRLSSYEDQGRRAREEVLAALRVAGRFYVARDGTTYWFWTGPHRLLTIAGPEFASALAVRLRVPPTKLKDLVAWVDACCREGGDRVEARMLSHYDPGRNLLYLDAFDGRVLLLDGSSVREVPNGTDSVFFVHRATWQPWNYQGPPSPDDVESLRRLFRFSNLDPRKALLTEPEASVVAVSFFVAAFLSSILPARPLLVLFGPTGSGKSTRCRGWVRWLFGPSADVTPVNPAKEDAVTAALTNLPLVALDHVDFRIPWLPSKLDTASTGGVVHLRELYTTNVLAEYPARAFVVLTTRNGAFVRPQDEHLPPRFLLLRLRRYEEFLSEDMLLRDVQRKRGALWSAWVEFVNGLVLRLPEAAPYEGTFRLADFARLLYVVADCWRPALVEARTVIDKLVKLQEDFLFERRASDPKTVLLGALAHLAEQRAGKRYVRELYEEVVEKGVPVSSPEALGRVLSALSPEALTASGLRLFSGRDGRGSWVVIQRMKDV